LIAGLILSSFPPERIKSSPHQRINTIENTHANKTNKEIANKMKSPNAMLLVKMVLPVSPIAA